MRSAASTWAFSAARTDQRRGAGADPIGQRRDVEIDAFARKGRALAVERLMQQELRHQDHGQQARAGEAARDRMRGRRRLGDRLAVAAGELFAHMLDDLPAPRIAFQRLGHDLAELAQPLRRRICRRRRAPARRSARPADAPAACAARAAPRLRFSLVASGAAISALACFGALRLFQVLDGKFELFDQLLAALGGLSELFAPGLGQQQLQALDLQPDDLGFALRRDLFRLLLRQQFALREDHRMGAGEVGRKRIGGRFPRSD